MPGDAVFDVVIAGGGIGGVICLKYAKDAGLKAVLLEARERVGGIWRDLPSWQDIQFRKEDWTLGDLPLAGEDQVSILRNIEAWVERFGLAPGVLETSTSTPWAYAHVAKSIMAHIAGRPVFVEPPRAAHTNHYDLVKLFARHDRANYPRLFWYLKYLWLALRHPKSRPMPIP